MRCDAREALDQLITKIMLPSPHNKWAGSKHFGLRDFLEDARTKPERLQEAVRELNLALQELGVEEQVESITGESGDGSTGTYVITFASAKDGEKKTLRV